MAPALCLWVLFRIFDEILHLADATLRSAAARRSPTRDFGTLTGLLNDGFHMAECVEWTIELV